VRLSSFDTLLARQDLKVLRETFADVSKSVGTCSSSQCAERGLKDNAASPSKLSFRCSAALSDPATHSLIVRSKYLSTLQPEASLPGVRQQERSSRCPGAQGLFSETTPSGQRLAGRILQTFPDTRGCVRAVSVPSENGVFNQLTMSLCFLTAISGNPQLRTATSTHIDLASDQPCGLAVTWTVHFLQRQPGATMDNVFLARGRQRACRHKMVCYPLQTAGLVYGLFSLLMATALHLLPRTMDFFLAGGNRCAHQ